MRLAHAVAIALSLPETHEEPHFEAQSFRVGRKIFATAPPDVGHLHVFVGPDDAHAAVAAAPDSCSLLSWGQKLAGVRIVLAKADPDAVRALLEKAWRARAPKRAIAKLDAERADPGRS